MTYSCTKCAKAFEHKRDLHRHLKRKTDCTVEAKPKQYECQHCNQAFSQRSNLSTHVKTCSKAVDARRLKALEEELAAIKARLPAAAGPSSSTTTQINTAPLGINIQGNENQVTNHQIIINFNSFGREDQTFLEQMSAEDIKKRLALQPDLEALLAMCRLIHMNSDHKENSNVMVKDGTSADPALVFRRGEWREEDIKDGTS